MPGQAQELILQAAQIPRAYALGYGPLAEAADLVASCSKRWPRRHGNSTGLGPDSLVEGIVQHARRGCALLADLDPESLLRLPTTAWEHAVLGGLEPDAHDQHRVLFDPAARMITPILLALMVRDGELERPRAFAIRFEPVGCPQRKKRCGVWHNHGAGATFVEAQLVAEGRRPPGDEEQGPFDRYAAPIASVPVERHHGESDKLMIVRIVAELLAVLDAAVEVLRAHGGYDDEIALLARTPVTADRVRYGAPLRKGALERTSHARWLGTSHAVWALLQRLKRPAALGLMPGLEPTNAPGPDEGLDYSHIVLGKRRGDELMRCINLIAGAHDRTEAERALRRLGAEPFDDEVLDGANIATDDADWYRTVGNLALRGPFGTQPTQHRLIVRRGALGAVHAYLVNRVPTLMMLEAADSSFLHSSDPYATCLDRRQRRFGSPIELDGHCHHDMWVGLTAVSMSTNLVFVAAARGRPPA
jgi:hypothetical protein